MPRRVYWDACAFIGLINREPGKYDDVRAVYNEARRGETVIVTSVFTFAEVLRAKCEGQFKPLSEADDAPIAQLLEQKFISRMLLDEGLAIAARRLVRAHPECHKPSDGIHLASALRANVDEMHTYDRSDLLTLDGKCLRADGHYLKICEARIISPAVPLPDENAVQTKLEFS